MRTTHLAIGIVVISLLAVGATPGSVTAQNNAEVCPGTPGDTLVIVFPDGTAVHSGSVTLLPGTEGDFVLCNGGSRDFTVEWSLNGEIEGISIGEAGDRSYPITVQNVSTQTSPQNPASAVTNHTDVSGPDIIVTPGRIAAVEVGEETYPVVVDADDRSQLNQASSDYEAARSRMLNAAERLNGTENVSSGFEEFNQTRDSYADVTENYTDIQLVLFDANATRVLEEYDQRHAEGVNNTRVHLKNAKENITGEVENDAFDIVGGLIVFLIVGSIVGAVGGRFVTDRILTQVEGKRRRSSAVDFRPKHLAGQAAAAVLLVGGAVALAVVLKLLNPIIVAIGAVIPL